MADIKVYGAPWCPDCKRSKKFLAEHRIPYDWIDIDDDAEGLRFVEALQQGGRTIPTIRFPGGSFLLEPSDQDLARKLGLKIEADRPAYDLAIVGGGPAGLVTMRLDETPANQVRPRQFATARKAPIHPTCRWEMKAPP